MEITKAIMKRTVKPKVKVMGYATVIRKPKD
jgi:hypothetical protein